MPTVKRRGSGNNYWLHIPNNYHPTMNPIIQGPALTHNIIMVTRILTAASGSDVSLVECMKHAWAVRARALSRSANRRGLPMRMVILLDHMGWLR